MHEVAKDRIAQLHEEARVARLAREGKKHRRARRQATKRVLVHVLAVRD
jgi:hypothetical protein